MDYTGIDRIAEAMRDHNRIMERQTESLLRMEHLVQRLVLDIETLLCGEPIEAQAVPLPSGDLDDPPTEFVPSAF